MLHHLPTPLLPHFASFFFFSIKHSSAIFNPPLYHSFLFFFNDTATTEIYTLSLHDALPILFMSSEPLPEPPSGAVFMVKPLSLATLKSELQGIVRRAEGAKVLARESAIVQATA